MGWWKIKRRPADILFSQQVRSERGCRCEKCGRMHESNSKGLGVSHFWPRGNECTRFDRENVEILCNIPCHQYFETHRTEYEAWKKERIGEKAYKLLMLRAHQVCKKDDKLILMALKNL